MNCMFCGAPLGASDYCGSCNRNVGAQKKALLLSNLYYNQGLEKAQIRDLSGAIDCLKRSLKLNKLNIQARNLLGLAYFETGEVVAALSEWVISKNIQPQGNLAAEFIQKLQGNPNRLDTINQTIKKYNQSLLYCRQGNVDMAVMQLKKVLAQNPKLIKGYHLLALLYIREQAYEKARKLLRSAAKIDKTNTTTLRFLREVDEQTGKVTSLEPRFRGLSREKEEKKAERSVYYYGNDLVIQPPAFRESSTVATLLNLGFGLVVGAALLWFLIVPGKIQKVNQEANQKVVEYSDQVASQAAELERLQSSIESSQSTVDSANDQVAQAEEKAASYDNLMKASAALREENYTTAANALQSVNPDLLSIEAKSVYDTVFGEVKTTLYRQYKKDGESAYESQDYATAIDQLTKAQEIDASDYNVLYYLAMAYRETGDTQNAIAQFQKIIDTFPNTKRATDAKDYMEALGGTPGNGDSGEGDTQGEEPQEEDSGDQPEDTGDNRGTEEGE